MWEKRAKRPASHFLDLPDIERAIRAAWDFVRQERKGYYRSAYRNALRTELAIMTGLRTGESGNLRPSDVHPDGTLDVRMSATLKMAKPRRAAFLNGLDQSPTLAALRQHIAENRLGREDRIFPTGEAAYDHWTVHRLGPMTGLQRRIPCLNGNPTEPRYLIHPHLWRSCFVVIARRYPRTVGLDPVPWESITQLGGWESVDTVRRYYYFADLDEALSDVRRAIPATLGRVEDRPPTHHVTPSGA